MLKYILISIAALVLVSCGDNSVNNPVNNDPVQSNYSLIFSSVSGNSKVELYSATRNFLATGYNDIGIKFFVNNQPKTTGFVKFKPKMYSYNNSGSMHSSPTSPEFNYNSEKGMFPGYASFTMASDTSMFWAGFFNYNNEFSIDSVLFSVTNLNSSQIKQFFEPTGGYNYFITLVSPYYPAQGLNDFKCLLHRSANEIDFEEITNAQMYIRPWMESMGHGSSNNVHPVYTSGGIYQGTVNFNMSGSWSVYDSVTINNITVTPSPSPKFMFDVP